MATGMCCLALAAAEAGARQSIKLTEFKIEPTTLRLGQSFTLRATANATGVELGSFLLRTAEEVKREHTLPGFELYANGKYYVAENNKYFLMDNGPRDRDPRPGAFAIELSTQGWRQGVHTLAFFASCRPHEGQFVAARHDLAVVVKGDRVTIDDLGDQATGRSTVIRTFAVRPLAVAAGQPVTVAATVRSQAIQGVRITNYYPVAQADTLPGFHYVAAKKRSFLGTPPDTVIAADAAPDADPETKQIALTLDTHAWPPGLHHLVFQALGHSGRAADYRAFAIKVADPRDRLDVSVEPSTPFGPGTHFGKFAQLRDGTLVCEGKFSTDGGRTWQGNTGSFGSGAAQLRDGRVLGLDYRCLPIKGEPGWYTVGRYDSLDNGRTFQASQARVHVPRAKPAMGHGPHKGPLFMRSIIERADGSLVAFMAGWFHGDDTPCPYGRGRPYSRTYTCESTDAGATWRYLTTIGYAHIGSEGFNEGTMRRLPNGHWLAVLRTGNASDLKCHDNPVMWSLSRDEGRTWSPPARTGLEGAYPGLAVLRDGLLVLSTGRPGAIIAFSADNGRTWTDHTVIDATPYSGYTDVVEIAPGELLVGFGQKAGLDPRTGTRDSQLRLARVRYRPKPQPPTPAPKN